MKDISEPKIFGPGAWLLLHFLALFYEIFDELKIVFKLYLYHLTCSLCQEHALEFMEKNPIEDATNLFEWTVRFHNHANVKTGKKEISLERAKELTLTNFRDPSLVEKFGPGIWIFFSVVSYHSNNSYQKGCILNIISFFTSQAQELSQWRYSRYFREIIVNFKKACLPEAPDKALFIEVYNFHNHVNRALNKPIPEYSQVLKWFQENCSHGCGVK